MENRYYSEVAVPIHSPANFRPIENKQTEFTFDWDDRFKDFMIERYGSSYVVSMDDRHPPKF